jgi:hypothetical protein
MRRGAIGLAIGVVALLSSPMNAMAERMVVACRWTPNSVQYELDTSKNTIKNRATQSIFRYRDNGDAIQWAEPAAYPGKTFMDIPGPSDQIGLFAVRDGLYSLDRNTLVLTVQELKPGKPNDPIVQHTSCQVFRNQIP